MKTKAVPYIVFDAVRVILFKKNGIFITDVGYKRNAKLLISSIYYEEKVLF